MDYNSSGFWSTDQLPHHQVNEETFRQLHNIWKYICTHFMILTSKNMKYELLRFLSLLSYPESSQQDIRKLAIAGFYYFGDDDTVVCYCCGLWKRNWSPTDVPLDIHQMFARSCAFHHRNRLVNIPFFTTANGGFRNLNETTIIVQTRRTGPTIVEPAEYIQADILAIIRHHDEASQPEYGIYDINNLPMANLHTTQSAHVNNEHRSVNVENRVMGGNVVSPDEPQINSVFFNLDTELNTNGRQQSNSTIAFQDNIQHDHSCRNISSLVRQPDKNMGIHVTTINGNISTEKQPCVVDAHVNCLETKQTEDSCHSVNLTGVKESKQKYKRAQTITNVKVNEQYDGLAESQQNSFTPHAQHNKTSVATGLKSDIQSQTKAVNVTNERGHATEGNHSIDNQFSFLCNIAGTHKNRHKRQSTYSVSHKGLRNAKTADAGINQTPPAYFQATEKNLFDNSDRKLQSIAGGNILDVGSNFGNTEMEKGCFGGKAEKITYGKRSSVNDERSDVGSNFGNTEMETGCFGGKAENITYGKRSSVNDERSDFGRNVGNAKMDAGCLGAKAKVITYDKRRSVKDERSADLTKKTQINRTNIISPPETRVRAFRNNSVCITNHLADGGFIYPGHKGLVQCGTCGIKLKISDLQEDMWIKHAEASKKCKFVLRRKGHDFVQAVKEGNEEIIQKHRELFAVQEKIKVRGLDNESHLLM